MPDPDDPLGHAASSADPTEGPLLPSDRPDGLSDDGLEFAQDAARAAAKAAGQPVRKKTYQNDKMFRRRVRPKVSGAHPDERDPQTLETLVGRLISSRGWELDLAVQGVFARWSALVGSDVGAHCTPEQLTDGRLIVRADSTAWATQLKFLAPTIVRRLNEELGDGTVVHVEIHGPAGPSWKKGRRSMRGRGPRDTYG